MNRPGNGSNPTAPCVAQSRYTAPLVAHGNPVTYLECRGNYVVCTTKTMVIETALPFLVNGQHWLTVLCTPAKLDCFVVGFLYNEGLIAGAEDILDLTIGLPPEEVIRVELRNRDQVLPQRRTLTSGCGGGITFVDLAAAREPVNSTLQVSPAEIGARMADLVETIAVDRRDIGGFHACALSSKDELVLVATDVGRHNTLDKIAGECLLRGISMRDAMLLTTGRISVEMLGKATRMQTPVVASMNSPTHLAAELANEWDITLAGYVRGKKMHIYTGWHRLATHDQYLRYRHRDARPVAYHGPREATPVSTLTGDSTIGGFHDANT